MSPDQFSLAMRALIPRAEVWLHRNREQHTTTMRVEVPSLHRERVVADLVTIAGAPDPQEQLEQVAHSLVLDVQRDAIHGYGLQPVLDAAREEGMKAVREHLTWLQEQIDRAEEELEPFPESSSARTALIGRIQGMRLSRRMLATHAGIVLEVGT